MKLYVGTYAKYAAGSLKGAWLDLADYETPEAFEAACRRLHRDERDPELMFQDVEASEDWEQGLYSESAIPREWWALKREHDAAAAEAARKPRKRDADAEEQARLCEKFLAATGWKGRMADLFRKGYRFVELADGAVYHIQKPKIETRFCCGEDDRGQGDDEYGSLAFAERVNAEKRTHDGFVAANMKPVDDEIAFWTASRENFRNWRDKGAFLRPAYYGQENGGALDRDYPATEEWRYRPEAVKLPEHARFVTEDDAARIAAGWRKVREQFAKRLETWWKRFGADHIQTWTYWSEA